MATGIVDNPNKVRSETFSALGKNWYFHRVGKIVFMSAAGDAHDVSAGTTTLFTLPDWLIPIATVQIGVENQITETAFLMIYSPDGRVTHYQKEAHTIINDAYVATYIAAN